MNMAKSEPETMQAVLQMIRDQYGSVEGYLEKTTKLRQEDFNMIRKNLIASRDGRSMYQTLLGFVLVILTVLVAMAVMNLQNTIRS